ncbi:MAG: alpha/beta fold hydrolase [Nocardioidaceae bacterium]
MTRPRLDLLGDPAGARDLVVLAHGGRQHSLDPPHDWRHAALRMWPFAAAARGAAPEAGIGLLRYRYVGWNGADAHPVTDLRTVLAGLPGNIERIVLIGHSMGARAVLSAAADPRVVGVLALAPWLPDGEPQSDLTGRTVVLAHGDLDRMTDPRLTAAFARRARQSGVPLVLFTVAGESHALLQRDRDWDELVRLFVDASLHGGTRALDAVTNADPGHGADPMPQWTRRRSRAGAIARVAISRARLPVR